LQTLKSIWLFATSLVIVVFSTNAQERVYASLDFYGDTIQFDYSKQAIVDYNSALSASSISAFHNQIKEADLSSILKGLADYKSQHKPDDWLFYQLIRRVAQHLSPKADNYHRYTLYKWFLLKYSGYDAILAISDHKILFYVQSDENIYNIPFRVKSGKQYVCLNYHDYGQIDFEKESFTEVTMQAPGVQRAFSYKLTRLPDFKSVEYLEKEVQFRYNESEYQFKLKLNPHVKSIFNNYPATDYAAYFDAPLSTETYSSLIPLLKKHVKKMSTRNGVDFLMRFTRYAFLFQPDTEVYGQEKRFLPEQTLLSEASDCEDRAALFFYLVKEVYNLSMIVLAYPEHVTIAVKFEKPIGHSIVYNGSKYSVCDPTPQKYDLRIGQLMPELRNRSYEIAYVYTPGTLAE
jgi:hypothetical protein